MSQADARLYVPAGDPARDEHLGRILSHLARLGEAHGWELALVGGCVRDWLLGKPSYDLDLTVGGAGGLAAAREAANELRGAYVPLDEEHDIGRVAFRDGISCDFARRVGPDLAADLRSRDLTINAMALPPLAAWHEGWPAAALIDPCGGRRDLASGVIRPIARANLESDPLRLLRVYRFAAVLGFRVSEQTRPWLAHVAPQLARVARERVLKELGELLARPAAAHLADMAERGIVAALFPALSGAAGGRAALRVAALEALLAAAAQRFPAHAEALVAYAAAPLGGGRPRAVTLKLAALLADLPAAGKRSPLETAGRELTLSVGELRLLLLLGQQAAAPAGLAADPAPDRLYRFFRAAGEEAPGVALLSLVAGAEGGAGLRQLAARLLDLYYDPASPIAHPTRWLSGDDLLQRFRIKPGPLVGQALEAVAEATARGEVRDAEGAAHWLLAWLEMQGQLPPSTSGHGGGKASPPG